MRETASTLVYSNRTGETTFLDVGKGDGEPGDGESVLEFEDSSLHGLTDGDDVGILSSDPINDELFEFKFEVAGPHVDLEPHDVVGTAKQQIH